MELKTASQLKVLGKFPDTATYIMVMWPTNDQVTSRAYQIILAWDVCKGHEYNDECVYIIPSYNSVYDWHVYDMFMSAD